jgi:hypothetical protein
VTPTEPTEKRWWSCARSDELRQIGVTGIHRATERVVEWIPGPRHPSRLLPTWMNETWTNDMAELG